MIRYVIDASALVKLVVPEDDSDKMQALAALLRAGTIQLLTPDFALTECANVLGRYARRTGTPQEDRQEAFQILCQLGLEEIAHRTLVEESLTLAMQHDRSVYDVLYLVLARGEGVSLITADERFVNALKSKGFSLILLSEWSVSFV
ncbi:MAG: type II toxin-antitoxin system VapC family toxin [Deltaproteobacteria bacterium]|nr:type II toxin-antitoxin system VapC family toxin [Deltaproteobacteria bacterium]